MATFTCSGKLLKQIFSSIGAISPQANLDVHSAGISTQVMDPSHVSLCQLELSITWFKSFACHQPISAGVPLLVVVPFLKDAETTVTMMNDSLMNISYTDAEMMHSYSFKLLQIDTDQLDIPETHYSIVHTMPTTEFKHILKDLNAIGATCTIDFKQNNVEFGTEGEIGNATILRHRGEGEDCKSTYSMRYLMLMTKFPLVKHTILRMNPDTPLCIDYVMDGGHLAFYLAPTLEDDS